MPELQTRRRLGGQRCGSAFRARVLLGVFFFFFYTKFSFSFTGLHGVYRVYYVTGKKCARKIVKNKLAKHYTNLLYS